MCFWVRGGGKMLKYAMKVVQAAIKVRFNLMVIVNDMRLCFMT